MTTNIPEISMAEAVRRARRMAEHMSFGWTTFASDYRRKDVCFARFLCWHIMRHDYRLSLGSIAHIYGKDHTSILNGVLRIEEHLKDDRHETRKLLADLRAAALVSTKKRNPVVKIIEAAKKEPPKPVEDPVDWRTPTPEDDRKIAQMVGVYSVMQISARLEIDEADVKKRIAAMGLKPWEARKERWQTRKVMNKPREGVVQKPFSKDEKQFLMANRGLPYRDLAEALGRSRRSIAGAIYRMKCEEAVRA